MDAGAAGPGHGAGAPLPPLPGAGAPAAGKPAAPSPAPPTYLIGSGRRVPAHPAAEYFPDMTPAEMEDLVADVKANGVKTAVAVTKSGLLLDGRHRAVAAERAGRPLPVREVDVDDAAATVFVVSLNLKRRHLTQSQRAAVAADIASGKPGRPAKPGSVDPGSPAAAPLDKPGSVDPGSGVTKAAAAEAVGVSEASVKRAAAVRKASPELHDAVKRGDVSVRDAADAVKEVRKLPQGERAAATAAVVEEVVPKRPSAKALDAEAAAKKKKPAGAARKAARKAAGPQPTDRRKPPPEGEDAQPAPPALPALPGAEARAPAPGMLDGVPVPPKLVAGIAGLQSRKPVAVLVFEAAELGLPMLRTKLAGS